MARSAHVVPAYCVPRTCVLQRQFPYHARVRVLILTSATLVCFAANSGIANGHALRTNGLQADPSLRMFIGEHDGLFVRLGARDPCDEQASQKQMSTMHGDHSGISFRSRT